jgi:hypothetical protein
MTHEKYLECIEACNKCAIICEHCASECLREKNMNAMARCIELDRACSEACRSAVAIMSQGSEFSNRFCALCAEVCQACGDECSKHKNMEHCQACAETCYECAESCREMAGAAV